MDKAGIVDRVLRFPGKCSSLIGKILYFVVFVSYFSEARADLIQCAKKQSFVDLKLNHENINNVIVDDKFSHSSVKKYTI